MHLLPPEFRDASLTSDVTRSRIRSASAFARASEGVLALRVLLMGPLGTGKTTLAVAIGKAAMAERNVNGMFVTTMQLDRARAQAALGHGDADLVQRAIEVPVLVLDELGAERGTSETVEEVLHERHSFKRQTIVATVLDGEGLKGRYPGGTLRRGFGGALVIVCNADAQPEAKTEVRRLKPPKPPEEPPRRAPALPDAWTGPEQLERALSLIGAPVKVDETALAERQAELRAQAARLLEEEQKETGT